MSVCVEVRGHHVGPGTGLETSGLIASACLPSHQSSFSPLIQNLHFIFWLKQNQNILNILKSNQEIILFIF